MGAWTDALILINNAILYVMIIVIIIVEVFSIRSWTQTVKEFVIQNEVNTLELRAIAAADLASVRFLDIASSISLARNITQHLANGSMAPAVNFTAPNYFNSESYDIPPSEYKYHTGWYHHIAQGNGMHPLVVEELNVTSLMRHPWHSVGDPLLSQGFGTPKGLVRFHPLQYLQGWTVNTYLCVSNDHRNNTNVTGFDPTCRRWWADAVRSPDSIIYSSPYVDAMSGATVITLSTAVMKVNETAGTRSVYGALWADVSMTGLQDFLDGLDGDHTFLIDTEGNLVAHKVFKNAAPLQERMYPDEEGKQNAFKDDQLATITSGALSGRQSYEYKGHHYMGGFAKVTGTSYIICIFSKIDPVVEKTDLVTSNGENWIYIIAYFLAYFALYTCVMASACLGETVRGYKQGFLKVGLPLAILFVLLVAMALPLSIVANAGVVSDTEDLLADQARETVRQLSINNGEWLTVYLQSAWYRNLQSLFHLTTRLDIITSEIAFNPSFQDDTVNATLLGQPLVPNPRLQGDNRNLISLGDTSWFVTNTTAAGALTLNATILDQINATQRLNQYFRSLYSTNTDFVLTYSGASTKLFRKYPGGVSDNLQYDCTQRPWYTLAQRSDWKNDSTSAEYGYKGTVYTAAYKDAFSGEWMITAARATTDGSSVFGGDLLLATITDIFSSITLSRTGRATLFDFEDNLVIADRDLTLSSDRSSPYSYHDMKAPPISDHLFSKMKSGPTFGPSTFTGSDGVDYVIYSKRLTDENLQRYGIMVAVPVSEVMEPVEPTIATIKSASLAVGLGLGLSCLVIIIVILLSSTLCSGKTFRNDQI